MKIEVLGSGCPKCKQLAANAEQALKELNKKGVVEKITDMNKIIEAGILMTPVLRVDGKIVFQGEIPGVEEIKKVLK